MAFGTITGILKRSIVKQGRPSMAVLELTCTAGTAGEAGAFPATIINPLAVDSVGSLFDLRGLKLYSVKVIPGATAPTDATDLTITDEYGIDLLGGKGSLPISASGFTSAIGHGCLEVETARNIKKSLGMCRISTAISERIKSGGNPILHLNL